MKMNILATVSAIAVLAAMPAIAADTQAQVKTSTEAGTTTDLKTDIKNAWKDVKEDTSQAYEEIKATVIDATDGNNNTAVTIDSRKTAAGTIGKPVLNGTGERVGTVKDIIVDADGNAKFVVVADGEFPGLNGKLAAFDYNILTKQNADGDVIAPLTEESIKNAAAFSYDANDANDTTRIIPANGYSVAKLLDAQLVDPAKKNIADVDNIAFRNGRASQIIVGFDKVLGMGGEKAVMDYRQAKLIRDGNEVDFQLSSNQAAQFETYKKNTVAN